MRQETDSHRAEVASRDSSTDFNAMGILIALKSANRKTGTPVDDALMGFLHGVDAPNSLAGFLGVAIRAQKILNSDDRQLLFSLNSRQRRRWRKALQRAIANAEPLADQIFGSNSKARELFLRVDGDNPLADGFCLKRHSCFGLLWHSYPNPAHEPKFRNLQAIVLGAHVAVMHSVLPMDKWLAGAGLDKATFESLYHACLAARQFIRRCPEYEPFLGKLPLISNVNDLPQKLVSYVAEIEQHKTA